MSKFLAKNEQTDPFCFLLAPELKSMSTPHSNWAWNQNKFEFKGLPESSEVDFFLFFSNQVDLANQFEAVLELLADEKDLSMGRIILFLNSTLLPEANPQLTAWIDAAGHFSDAICFTHRKNENAMAISQCKERFQTMKYPLETYVLGGKKLGALDTILNTNPGALLTFLIRLTCWKKMTPLKTIPIWLSLQTEKGSGPCHLPFTLEIQSESFLLDPTVSLNCFEHCP